MQLHAWRGFREVILLGRTAALDEAPVSSKQSDRAPRPGRKGPEGGRAQLDGALAQQIDSAE